MILNEMRRRMEKGAEVRRRIQRVKEQMDWTERRRATMRSIRPRKGS